MELRQRNKVISYNEDSYYEGLGVFDIDEAEDKEAMVDCIFRIIDYINSECPMGHKSDYFMMCADLCYKFVVRFPIYNKFNRVFLKKLVEMLDNPFMKKKQKQIIQDYIHEVKKLL